MTPGGGSGRDEPPLDIQIPDDARELDRDVLAYRREMRAQRRILSKPIKVLTPHAAQSSAKSAKNPIMIGSKCGGKAGWPGAAGGVNELPANDTASTT